MAPSPNRINTLLDVLDRADQLEAQSREHILATVQSLDPQRDPEVLAKAVDAHLAERTTAPSLIPGTTPSSFNFHWKRPKGVAEQQTRLRRTRWMKWMDKGVFDVDARMRLLWKAFGGGAILGGPLFAFLMHLSTNNPNQAPLGLTLFFGMMLGVLMGGVSLLMILQFHLFKRFPVLRFEADLPKSEAQYLQHADTRAYLKAVLASPLPTLLGGDVRQLEMMRDAHDKVQTRTAEKVAEAQAAEQRLAKAQQQAEHLAQRDTRLAQLLAQDPEA